MIWWTLGDVMTHKAIVRMPKWFQKGLCRAGKKCQPPAKLVLQLVLQLDRIDMAQKCEVAWWWLAADLMQY